MDVTLPSEEFLLATTMERAPDLTFEAEPFVPADSKTFRYIVAKNHTSVSFDDHADADPTVRSFTRLASYDSDALYYVEWDVDELTPVESIAELSGGVLQATGNADAWELKLRFDARESVSAFFEEWENAGVPYEVTRVSTETGARTSQYDLTLEQRSALVTAFEMGYFDVPRRATAGEVADTLDISDSAFLQRLRRGMTGLVGNAVVVGDPT